MTDLISRYSNALVDWRCDGGPFGAVEAAEKELRAALLEHVGEGWVMVPKEPTPQMRKAAVDAWLDCDSKLLLNKAAAALRAGIAAFSEFRRLHDAG